MDGRWKQCLAGGLVAAAVGCGTTQKQLVPETPPPVAQKPVTNAAQFAKATQAAPPAAVPRASLKPDTYVTMGALKEQAAEEAERPQAERDAYRHQARQSYQQALAVDPNYVPAYTALAKSYCTTDEKDKAHAMFAKAVALAPNDATLWYEQGAAQARAKDFPNAIQSLNRAAQLAPENKTIQKLLGFTLARGGWYEESLNALVKIMPEAEARYNLARMMQQNQHGDAADVQLRLAVQMDPANEPARNMLAAGQPADSGVRQTGHQAPVAPAQPTPPADPQAVAPAQPPSALPPVMLGGNGQPE